MKTDKRTRRLSRRNLSKFLAFSLGVPLAGLSPFVSPSAHAASDTWNNGAGDSLWQSSANWSTGAGFPGATSGFSSTDDATFSATGASGTIVLGGTVNIRSLLFGVSGGDAASFSIGSAGDTLNFTTGGGVTINAGVTAAQQIGVAGTTINLPNTLTAATTLTNNGTGLLNVAGNLVENAPTGSSTTVNSSLLTVTGSGDTTISGSVTNAGVALSTTVGTSLLKTGTGTLTLSNGSVWAGNAAQATASTTNQFPLVVRAGTLLLDGGTHSVTGETVIGGFTTAGATGNNAKIQVDSGSLNISGYLSIGRGNGTGSVSSDLILNNAATVTAGNMSAGFNGGSALNQPAGTITLNNTSGLTISGNGVFNIAESAGSNIVMTMNGASTLMAAGTGVKYIGNGGTGSLTLNDTSSVSFGSGTVYVSYKNGVGTLNVNPGTTFGTNSEIRVAGSDANGTFSGSGTINVNGGTLNAAALTLARNNNDVASTLSATLNLTSGAVNVSTGSTLVGWRGTSSTGTLNLSGGSFNQGTTTASTNMDVGILAGAKGTVNVSGSGTLAMEKNSNIRFSTNSANAASNSLNISGGNVTFYSDAGSTLGGSGVIDMMNTAATGTNTINLDGGTLTANVIKSTNTTGTRILNLNGGTLKAASATTAFVSGLTTANVRDGGAIIDTNGNDVTISQALVHSTVNGDNATDGGLTKGGTGTLTLTGANTYTGTTTVNGGKLIVSGSLAGTTSAAVAHGATLSDDGYINSAATVTSAGIVQGQGSIGSITISASGTLAPGSAATSSQHGTMTANGDVSLTDSTSTFSLRLGVDTAADSDSLALASGNVTLNGATLQLTLGTNYTRQADGFTYVIINGLAANSVISGTFAQGSSITASNGDTFNILYNVDSTGLNAGNDVVLQLQAVPEPETWAMVFAGAGMLSLAQRLRKRRA